MSARAYVDMLLFNLSAFVLGTGELLIPNLGATYPGRCLAVILTAAAVGGVWRIAREKRVFQYAAFGAGMSGLLIFWVYSPTTRLLWPLLPLIAAGGLR